MTDPTEELIYFNGVDGNRGGYAMPPMSIRTLVALARGARIDPVTVERLRYINAKRDSETYGWPDDIDLKNVREAGWAVLIHENEDLEVRKVLERLYEHRRAQIMDDSIVKLLTVGAGETDYVAWLNRHQVHAGSPEPSLVPCYLLIAGSPSQIPFSFSQGLSTEYIPGRIHFDNAAEYAAYIDSLIAYENSAIPQTGKEVVYFAPCRDNDNATKASVNRLVRPLAGLTPEPDGAPPLPLSRTTVALRRGFRQRELLVDQATKTNLCEIFSPPNGQKAPSLLFTASHGMIRNRHDLQQRADQGALICQEWQGGVPLPAHYFAAADLPVTARLHGLIAFLFACYSGGTPTIDRFFQQGFVPRELTDTPFLSALPKALMARPGGGALACIAHIDRAWASSFNKRRIVTQIKPFEKAIERLLRGFPVGFALRDFSDRYARLSVDISNTLFRIENQEIPSDTFIDLMWDWIERNDAEGYVLIGDPAAHLRVDDLV